MLETTRGFHKVKWTKLAKVHICDWLILLLLGVIEIILNMLEPFHRFVGEGMMTDLMFPLKDETVPFWFIPLCAVLLPIAIFIVFYIKRKDDRDLHHAILGILFSVLVSGVIIDSIKKVVGRPRPNFFWRCFPDGKAAFDSVTKGVICHGDKSVIKEGYQSFPSGHSSWSFSGLTFLTLYLSEKLNVFDGKGHVSKLCVAFFPMLVASLVGVSRIDDYWHHWQDVVVGALLGTTVAFLCYQHFFSYPFEANGSAHYRAYTSIPRSYEDSDVREARDNDSPESSRLI